MLVSACRPRFAPTTLVLLVLAGLLLGCGGGSTVADDNPAASQDPNLPRTNYYEIRTEYGRLVVRLFDETPGHRDNFKRLVQQRLYDGTTFHRVVDGFLIQGGDPNSKDQDLTNDGQGGPGYTIASEIRDDLTHRRGILAAARPGDGQDPRRRSSGSQFYIVQGDASSLDGLHTVFGELMEGFSVLDRIASLPTRRNERRPAPVWLADQPPIPVYMQVRPIENYRGAGSR
ncbi:MAG: peptidylprolyl isomerase [Bacteroidota bacterium]